MESWRETKRRLFDPTDRHVMVASHRGKFSSSVMENTSLAFTLAIGQGADMVEMDLARTKDGILVGHHDKTMERLFHHPGKIEEYTAEELMRMPLYNYVGEVCQERLETFGEILKALKDRTILVLDKCWDYWDQVYVELAKEGMVEQAVWKFYIENDAACRWAGKHTDCMYVPMLRDVVWLKRVEKLQATSLVPALEILPEKETDPVYQQETFRWLSDHGIKVWCNSLSLGKRLVYGAGNDDLKSLRQGGDQGWGKLVGKGVSIIQTDWPCELRQYLAGTYMQGFEDLQQKSEYLCEKRNNKQR